MKAIVVLAIVIACAVTNNASGSGSAQPPGNSNPQPGSAPPPGNSNPQPGATSGGSQAPPVASGAQPTSITQNTSGGQPASANQPASGGQNSGGVQPPAVSGGQNIDKLGNVVAKIIHNKGKGRVFQGSNNNEGVNSYKDNVKGNGDMIVKNTGGNVIGGLKNTAGATSVDQTTNGNKNNDVDDNSVSYNKAGSDVSDAVANTVGQAFSAVGSNAINQTQNNNAGVNDFFNS